MCLFADLCAVGVGVWMERATLWTVHCWSMWIWRGSSWRLRMTKIQIHSETSALTSVPWSPTSSRMCQVHTHHLIPTTWNSLLGLYFTIILALWPKAYVLLFFATWYGCLCVFSSTPKEEHFPSAVSQTQFVYAVQPLGRALQHHVHSSRPLQWP